MAVMWWMPSNRMALPTLAHPGAARRAAGGVSGLGLGARLGRLLGGLAARRRLALARRGRLLGRRLPLGGPALRAVLEVGDELAQLGDAALGGLRGAGAARGGQRLREVAGDALAQPVRAQALEE